MLIPKNEYLADVVEWRISESKEKQTPVVVAIVEIAKGEHTGRRLFWRGWLSPDAIDRTLEQLEAAGYTGEEPLSTLRGFGTKRVIVVVDHEEAINKRTQKPFTVARGAWLKKVPTLEGTPTLSPAIVDRLALGKLKPARQSAAAAHENGAGADLEDEPPPDDAPIFDENGQPLF